MSLPKAVYDFRIAPLTFDFVTFLGLAKLFFLVKNSSKFDVVLIKPFFRNSSVYERSVFESNMHNVRFDNIVLQSCSLVKDIKNLLILTDLSFSNSIVADFPPGFKVIEPISPENVPSVTPVPCNFIYFEQFKETGYKPILFEPDMRGQVLNEKRITLSLRCSPQKPERSSDFDTWYRVYKELTNDGFEVIVIPDHDDFIGGRTYKKYDWFVDEYAATSFRQRIRLYGSSVLNVSSPAGWNMLLIFSELSFLIPGYLDSRYSTSNQDIFNRKGPKVGSQPYWFNDNQLIDWSEWRNLDYKVLLNLIYTCLKNGN